MPTHNGDVMHVQSQMKAFVKSMVRGQDMSILSDDGEILTCFCSFDRKLQNYLLLIDKKQRSIPFLRIKEVFQGVEPQGVTAPLDELCATIMMDTGERLSFWFADVRECESFSLYMQFILDGKL